MECTSGDLSNKNNALIIMEPSHAEGDSNVLLLKDMMLDEQEQQCVLEVYSEAPNEFTLPDNFPDEIHIDINLDTDDIPYFDETSVIPKRVTAANQVLPLLTSVYEERSVEEDSGLANEWRDVFQALTDGIQRDNCTCNLCGCVFVSPTKLLSHAVEVHCETDLKGLQQCFVCRKSYVFSAALNAHLEQHHGLPAPHLTCTVCFTQLNSRSELKAHERKHELAEPCKMCFARFPSRHQLSQHVDMVHTRPFPCPHCRVSFNFQATLRRHLKRHCFFSSSCCAKCRWRPDQAVDAELALLEHLNLCFNQDDLQSFISTVVEEDRQEFEMEPFLKSYYELSKLDPVKNKNKSDVEKCLSCMVSAVDRVIGPSIPIQPKSNAVESFCKLCTRTVSSLSQIPTHVEECHPKSKQCPICKKRFPSVKRAQNHTRLHFPASEVDPKEYRCQYCEKLFKASGKLNRHIESVHSVKVVERNFECHLCSKQFQSPIIRDRHLMTHNIVGASLPSSETAPAPIKCSYCSCTFIKHSFLSKHTEKYHSRQTSSTSFTKEIKATFQCKSCGEELESLSKLKRHMLYQHGAASQKNRFQCTQCSIGCRTAVGLKVHMRTHTNERPYQCLYCEKTFKRMQAMNFHQKRVHLNNVDEPDAKQKLYCCSEKDCTVKFAKQNCILKHFLRAHRNFRRFICGFCGESYCQNQELKTHMTNKHSLVAPNVAVKETSKQTDVYVFPSIDTLPTTHPHSMLISQIIEDQKKKTENLPQFKAVVDEVPIKKSKFVKKVEEMKKKEEEISEKVATVLDRSIKTNCSILNQESSEVVEGETIIYDNTTITHPSVPDLEAIAAPNTENSLNLSSMNNETYLNIINQAYEKMKPQFPEMVAVVNMPSKESEVAVVSVPQQNLVQPIIIAASDDDHEISVETEKSAMITKKHTNMHTYPFKCDVTDCEKTFGDSGKLVRHKKTHSDVRPYKCATCSKTFREKGNLLVHMRSHSKEKPYSCDQCSKQYRYLQEYKRHVLEHSGTTFSHKCPQCPDKVFKHVKDLNRHKRTHDNESSGFKCEICGAVLARKDTLLLHQARKHQSNQFKCNICSKSFALEQQLKQHKNTHSGNKEHKCDDCGRTFALRSYLFSHLKRHEKQKKYIQCSQCPRKFSNQQNLEVHQATFHEKGAMLQKRQQKQEALQKHEDARRAALASALEEDMLHVDFDLDEDPSSQVVYLQVLSDADLALLPS